MHLRVLLLALLLLTIVMLASSSSSAVECPPGGLVINTTGTFICPVPVEEINYSFVGLTLLQNESTLVLSSVCLTAGGCTYDIKVYDYTGGSMQLRDTVIRSVPAGGSFSINYTVSGIGIVELAVNDMYYGFFYSPSAPVSRVSGTLKEMAGEDLFVEIMVALLAVSIPIGWLATREIGLSGLALTGMSFPIYMFAYVLIGDAWISLMISVMSSFIGIIYLIISRGEPA